MANKIVWGRDLMKGFKIENKSIFGGNVDDLAPFQFLHQDEKTEDWIQAVADFYEMIGWNNVEKKAHSIQKLFWLRHGILDPSDYIINPNHNNYYNLVHALIPDQNISPLEQFYPLIPPLVDILRGEFTKRDNRFTVDIRDPESIAEAFSFKRDQFESVLRQQALLEKQNALYQMGITEEYNPQEYFAQIQALQRQLDEVEFKAKNFRTTGAKWATKVLDIQEKRYNLYEIEPEGFECGLVTDQEIWHLDLLDDDFKLELINPKWLDRHKGPNKKYFSEGDYILWFDFGSAGDILNSFGRRMSEEDILKLKDIYVRANMVVPDYLKSHQDGYYDYRKPWSEATDLNPALNDAQLGMELSYSFSRHPNFDHNIEVDILNPTWGRRLNGAPQMFRIMRLYWRSMKRIGWLTKINRDGSIEKPDWVDENYRVTIEPKYDTSVTKTKTKDNLIYGEHIDWTWTGDWRHVIKISPNQSHTFWGNAKDTFNSIYIDGGPVKFQFKGRNNPFDSKPPIEGCDYTYFNSGNRSFVKRGEAFQIIYNICMNKVPRKIMEDRGLKVAVHNSMLPKSNLSEEAGSVNPHEILDEKLDQSQIFDYSYDSELIRGIGQPPLPSIMNLSTIQEAQFYSNLAREIKWEAGELMGISRQRAGGQKTSETAYSVQQGVSYSETQTEKYYEQHTNLMKRVRQLMLDAAQYYSTFHESAREVYRNSNDENVWLDIEGLDNLTPHYSIDIQSTANVRAALNKISTWIENTNTLDIPASAYIEGLISSSVPTLKGLIREAELRKEQADEQIRQDQKDQFSQQMQAQAEEAEKERIFQAEQNELDRQSDENVAMIRALGGIQTDVDSNKIPDAQQNMQAFMKQQEMLDKRRQQQEQINLQRQANLDKNLLEREKSLNELEKEKIKGEYNLKVAKENKNKYDKTKK